MQDDIIVFLGPTLAADAARRLLDANYRPPARRNDIAAASAEFPRAILLIDGLFENAPAVSHKEILWALRCGIHVLGAASMGALRAAELQGVGMVGIGEVFQAYSTGRYDRDDAVALLHGPAELGYPSLTWPLVDAWATFAEARRADAISDGQHEALHLAAASLFYKQRTMESVVAAAQACSGACADLSVAILEAHAVTQKATDAKALLTYAAQNYEQFNEPIARRGSISQTPSTGVRSSEPSSCAGSACNRPISPAFWRTPGDCRGTNTCFARRWACFLLNCGSGKPGMLSRAPV